MSLQRREVLRYVYPDYCLVVWNRETGEEVDRVHHGDIVIAVADETRGTIKIVTPAGKIGWVYYDSQRLLKIGHCSLEHDL